VIGFVMRSEGLEFPQAIERLAARRACRFRAKRRRSASGLSGQATLAALSSSRRKYFEQQLRASAGKAGLDYLKRRGLSDDTMRRFRLGFSRPTAGHGLKAALKKAGIPGGHRLEAGLLIKPEDGSPCL
jgi:DNA primase